MYHTRILNENSQNQKFIISREVATFDDPQIDLNDLKKIEPYDFWLDRPLKVPNQP